MSALAARAELAARNVATASKLGLVEMAAAEGYTPGQFSMQRLASDIARAREWIGYLDAGTVPPEFATLRLHEARAVAIELMDDIEKRDAAWRDYFYPKLRSIDAEVSGAGGAPLDLTVNFVKPGES